MASRSLRQKGKQDFFMSFLCINAVVLAEDLVNAENPVLKYLLTYKVSQAVRACGG
jgi:hypothetical protein